jgi:hypothetical protein
MPMTKQEIINLADRCYSRCIGNCSNYGTPSFSIDRGNKLFGYRNSGCYRAHTLSHCDTSAIWCPFWHTLKNAKEEDIALLKSLTYYDLLPYAEPLYVTKFYKELRDCLLTNTSEEVVKLFKYVDNSNESRSQYFNKMENHVFFIDRDEFRVIVCQTLRRHRFSHTDNRVLYPGANDWLLPTVLVSDQFIKYGGKNPKLERYFYGNQIQVSFACNPADNCDIAQQIFKYNKETKDVEIEFNDIKHNKNMLSVKFNTLTGEQR